MSEQVAGVRIEIRGTQPKIWRRVEVPIYISLTTLHNIIQTAFDWEGEHMAAFFIGEEDYSAPNIFGDHVDADHTSDEMRLSDVVRRGIKRFKYVYDFGDYWEHDIILGKVRVAKKPMEFAKLLGGALPAPVEDGGGGDWFDFIDDDDDEFDDDYLDSILEGIEFDYDELDDYEEEEFLSWLEEMEFDEEEFDKDTMQVLLRTVPLT